GRRGAPRRRHGVACRGTGRKHSARLLWPGAVGARLPRWRQAGSGVLHLLADDFHHVRVGQRGHVARVLAGGNGFQHAAHDLAGARLRHVRHQPHAARPGDGADVVGDGLLDLVDQRVAGFDAGTERAVDLRHGALDVVGNGHHSGFADFRHGHAGGFDLLGAEAVAGDVDDVVDAAQHAHVAVLGDHGAVAGDVRPVAPVLAVLVAVLAVVGLDEALV